MVTVSIRENRTSVLEGYIDSDCDEETAIKLFKKACYKHFGEIVSAFAVQKITLKHGKVQWKAAGSIAYLGGLRNIEVDIAELEE